MLGLIPADRLRRPIYLGLQQSSVRLHMLRFRVSFNAAASMMAQAFYIAGMDVTLAPCALTRSLNVAASKPTSG